MPERVVLVDGSSLIFRAYFAIPGHFSTSKGLHTNATYGFALTFRKLMDGKRPAFGAVVFDAPGGTFRSEKYPEYKAQRPKLNTDLIEQLPWIDRVVDAHGFPRLRVEGYEADDVIGTLTRLALEAGHEVLIVSGDKDFAQLLGERVKMLDSFNNVTYDPELARKKWGVPPEQFVDYLAMLGDKVDNIPGVPGIGKKGAAQLLEKYGSLDAILAATEELKGRQKTTLTENREQALLSRELATIDRQVPLELGLADLALPEIAPESLNELFRELEFNTLLSAETREEDARVEGATYTGCAEPDAARAALEAACSVGTVALVPIFDPRPYNKPWLCGLAFSAESSSATYVPLPEGSLEGGAWGFLRAWLEDEAQPKVTHGAKACWLGLKRRGVELRGVEFDTQLASFLIEPTKLIPHRLDQLVREYLHRTTRERKAVTGSGKKEIPFADVPLEEAADYAGHLAAALSEMHAQVRERLAESGLEQQLFDLDLLLAWVLGEMELTGTRVDVADLTALGKEFRARLDGIVATIHDMAGREFNVNSTKQLAIVLFEELGLPVIKKTKTGYSTKMEVLERLAKEHPIAEQIVEQRKLAKLINTYTDVLSAAADPETGRVHATFQQTVGATGRLISTDPDLQRTPVKTPEGERIRRAFIPSDGCQLLVADWSQIELRVMAHVSQDPLLLEAYREGADIHARTAARLFDVEPEAVTKDQRRIGKTVNFATTYGQGATALGQILGIPRKDAKRFIERYFKAYSGVRAWLDKTIEDAQESGWVSTLFGRKRFIPELTSHNPMVRTAGTRIAANTPLQGSVADICKQAMLDLHRRLRADGLQAQLLMQIHDELVLDVPEDEVGPVTELVRDVMEHVVELDVPLVVEIGVGMSWAAAK